MGLDGFLVILCRECHPPWKIRPYDRVINRHDPLVKFWCFVPHRPPTFLHHLTTAEPHHYCFTVAFLVRMGFQKSELCKMRREWVAKNICWWKKCQHGGLMGIACFKKGWRLPQIQTMSQDDNSKGSLVKAHFLISGLSTFWGISGELLMLGNQWWIDQMICELFIPCIS